MDLNRADLGLLVSLDALLSERSVTGAARRLGISQPALSAQLARLRDLMGDDILVGNAHGMVPTARAQAVQAPLRTLLQDMSDLIFAEAAFDPATSERRFHVSATDVSLAAILPTVLGKICEEAPGIRITTAPLDHDRMAADAEAGILDLVITGATRMPATFQTVRLINLVNRVAWRRGHPELSAAISLDEFCRMPQLNVTPVEGRLDGPIDQLLRAAGRSRRVIASITSYALAPALLRSSNLVAVVPEILLRLDGDGLVSAPLPLEQQPPAINLGWHPRHRNDRAHKWLRELVVSATRELKGPGGEKHDGAG